MILVSGGTGLLGSHLLVKLCEEKDGIRAIYRSEKKKIQTAQLFDYYLGEKGSTLFAKIEWLLGDITDIPFLEVAMKDCTDVYHCAAIVSFHKKDFNRMMKINREGTANMVNTALGLGVEKFCFVSSTASIGSVEGVMINETTPWKNGPTISGYSVSKYSAEKEVWRAAEEGLNVTIVNPCVIIGAGNWNESSLTLFKTISKKLSYYPTGGNATVDARDVANIMVALMDKNMFNERYLCIGSNQSFQHLMTTIAQEMKISPPTKVGKRSLVKFVKAFIDLWSLISGRRSSITKETVENLYATRTYDNSKVVNALNYSFIPLEESVANAVKGRVL